MRVFQHANYHYIENRKRAYVASGTVIIVGIVGMIMNLFTIGSWQNYGVDFTGGSLVQVRFLDDVAAGPVRSAVPGASEVTRFDQQNEFVIRAPLEDGMPVDSLSAQMEAQLAQAFGAGRFEIVRTELVGPKIGAELQQKATLAVLVSFALTLIYLAFRFEWRFGVAAIIATVHDLLITVGILALMRIEISVTTVAAVLTIVGYSLNDTIIVFDRIREALGKKGARKADYVGLINRAINETLPRTTLTLVSSFVVLLAILVLGPVVIRSFAFVLLVGITVGTFSSIFVASPALVEIQKRWGRGDESKPKKTRPVPATV
jgi:preprotein translocase subunit SecF